MNANLLMDPVFTVACHDGERQQLSLPELLAQLGAGRIHSYSGAQHHQVDALHIFLSHLGAHVLELAGEESVAQSAEFWRAGLRQLAGEWGDDAWTLIVENASRPAFLQPPTERIADYQPKAVAPDQFDVLLLAKNNDAKGARLHPLDLESWVIALISIQTMGGYNGGGTVAISRMNMGFGSRVLVGSYEDLSASGRWVEDVIRLGVHRETLLTAPWPYRADGIRLLWLHHWDTDEGITFSDLHPYYVEVCRRYRVLPKGEGLIMFGRAAKVSRLAGAPEQNGNVGDVWTPIHRSEAKSLTPNDLSLGLVRDLLFGSGDYQPALMQQLTASQRPGWFTASVLVRGKGTTNGYHQRLIRIPGKAKSLLMRAGAERDRISERSVWALERAAGIRNRCLKPALFSLLEGGPEGWPAGNGREVRSWADRLLATFDAAWEQAYFDWLWASIDHADVDARNAWTTQLADCGKKTLKHAIESSPIRKGRAYRSRVRADGLYHNTLNKHFPIEETLHVAAD